MLKIAITGHRELLNEEDVRREIALSFAYFKAQYGSIQAISALATGADTIFAQEAQKAGASLKVVLPFSLSDYQQDFTDAERAELKTLLATCIQPYEELTTLKTHTNDERNEAYLAVGKKLVDEADVLMAVWDGQLANGKGGTGDIVEYAKAQGKEVHIIKVVRPQKKMNTIFYSLFDEYDKAALKLKSRFTIFWLGGIAFGLAAVIVFAVSISFSNDLPDILKGFWLPILEGVFVFISFFSLGILAPTYKKSFLNQRHWAEYLRIHDLMSNCGFELATDYKIHKNYPISEEIEALKLAYIPLKTEMLDLESGKTKIISFVESQKKYHTDVRIKRYENFEHIIEKTLKIILWTFAGVVMLKLVFELMEYNHNHFIQKNIYLLSICKFAVIFLPALYAALEGIFFFSEWKRNITISQAVYDKYNSLLKVLDLCQSIDQLKELSVDLNNSFWNEQQKWLEWYHNKKVEARV